ncbi:hypothetical protein NUW58_g365 [Xylaria curta]|uniref:Uncharacterized protein n=1 Tax=Xylaria curta TaxID=42375 RepID=A0ACC1PPM6_9PEZI|nr:hypothetical protein NUW58_g365 [Xylaria curta]
MDSHVSQTSPPHDCTLCVVAIGNSSAVQPMLAPPRRRRRRLPVYYPPVRTATLGGTQSRYSTELHSALGGGMLEYLTITTVSSLLDTDSPSNNIETPWRVLGETAAQCDQVQHNIRILRVRLNLKLDVAVSVHMCRKFRPYQHRPTNRCARSRYRQTPTARWSVGGISPPEKLWKHGIDTTPLAARWRGRAAGNPIRCALPRSPHAKLFTHGDLDRTRGRIEYLTLGSESWWTNIRRTYTVTSWFSHRYCQLGVFPACDCARVHYRATIVNSLHSVQPLLE